MAYEIETRTVAALTAWAADNGKRPAGPNRTEVVIPLAQ
jgi:hypothetical protein